MLVTQSHLTLCNPMDHVLYPCNSPVKDSGWSGLPFPFPGALPDPGIEPRSPTLRLSGKEFDCNAGAAGDLGSIPGLGRSPAGGHGNPLQYSCLENPCGQRSLADCSPWGHKEMDMAEKCTMYTEWKTQLIVKTSIFSK